MKYASFKESNFIKIKNVNISNFIAFKYGIEQYNVGKNIQARLIRQFIKSAFNSIFNSKPSNVYYKNSKNFLSIYSKDWWNI
ncbi:MAG: hypothetical protein CMJ05_03900 [Pelagibacterales bacterium]|nr:hypothetical protein [Pelagibacterales bacterium]|tara:strand:+ start:4877 stop:5122 length:246 start_codon:yes stop_codon:yes gene_type:complete